MLDYLFVTSIPELIGLSVIVCLAGIVRGCIGFGFSALVVASTSLWIDVKYTVVMVIFMEVIASLFMLKSIKNEIDYPLLKVLLIGGSFATVLGVWALVTIDPDWHQVLMSVYLLFIALASLFNFQFKTPMTKARMHLMGIIAGFYGGLAAIGGVFIALILNSSNYPVKNIRATIVVLFFFSEAVFFSAAYYNNLITKEVILTSLVLSLPMLIGVLYGSKLFNFLPEKTLKQIVLISLLILSVIGLVKTTLN